MRTLAVVSAGGGAGRTTLAANIAGALTQAGSACLAVDADPSNGLGLHMGMAPEEPWGLSAPELTPRRLESWLARAAGGVPYLPFGRRALDELVALEADMTLAPRWLADRLRAVVPERIDTLVVDAPAGLGPWTRQVLAAADVALCVLVPDPAAYAGLPLVLQGLATAPESWFVLNRADGRTGIGRDVEAALRLTLGDRLLPVCIPEDPVVAEALAARRLLLRQAGASQVTFAIDTLAAALASPGRAAARTPQPPTSHAVAPAVVG